jgi:SAM-dependent methyltransferase
VQAKGWDWDKAEKSPWLDPSAESYYLLHRWTDAGYETFLDLGCGLGRHSLQFAEAGFEVTAFDLSEQAVRQTLSSARNEGLDIRGIVGDLHSLPFDDGEFQCILSFLTISHTDTAGMFRAMSELKRVLKAGGECYITLCSKKSGSYLSGSGVKLDDNSIVKNDDGPEKGVPHFYADEAILDSLFEGFGIIHLRHINDLVYNGSRFDNWHYFALLHKPDNP